MFTGELGISPFITRTEFTFLALSIIMLAFFTLKKNKMFLYGTISSSTFIPSLFHAVQKASHQAPTAVVTAKLV